jgi:hypothetical protein
MKVLALPLCFASVLKAQSVQELVTMGDALDEKNRNSDALALYVKADAIKPNNAEIHRRISKQYTQLMLDASSSSEKTELGGKALDAAKRAVAADPKNSQAHLALAIVYGRNAPTRGRNGRAPRSGKRPCLVRPWTLELRNRQLPSRLENPRPDHLRQAP